jgi:hypothetical protein
MSFAYPTVMAASPIGIRSRVEMKTASRLHVIPGLDPGIPADSGGWCDPRIKSGDDENAAVRQTKSFYETNLKR